MYGRNIEEKAINFITDTIDYLDSNQIIDLLDNMALDDIIDYVESTDKFKVLDLKEYEELEESKSGDLIDEAENLKNLTNKSKELGLILELTENLERKLAVINKDLRLDHESIIKTILELDK